MIDAISGQGFLDAAGVEGWRVVSDGACAFFRTDSFATSARFVPAIGGLAGTERYPDVDIRAGGVTVRLVTIADDYYGMTRRDVDLAVRISAIAREQGLSADPSGVQSVLLVVGSLSNPEVMPFWQAVLGYARRPDSPEEDLVDPAYRGPAVWFETMEEARPDGDGAIHVGVWVPHEEAEARVAAALAAGGRLVRDDFAPAWWTLADAAGNEADVATIMGRD
ncbi:MAG: 4a-hydroxytetrahydrobiopterin dehydratase [Planctomycetaceae bacterium]